MYIFYTYIHIYIKEEGEFINKKTWDEESRWVFFSLWVMNSGERCIYIQRERERQNYIESRRERKRYKIKGRGG